MGISVIFLCAGYGTRLERDILNCSEDDSNRDLLGLAKAMLPIGGKSLIAHWIDVLNGMDEFDHLCLVTNAKFYSQFASLSKNYGLKVKVINDETTCNEDRMGAVASINFAIDRFGLGNSDLLIIGGDTLMYGDFSLKIFLEQFKVHKKAHSMCGLVTVYKCPDEDVSKHGIMEVDKETWKVLGFLEKPQMHETSSRLACPCFYLLSTNCASLVNHFLLEKKDAPLKEKDATGNFIKYLIHSSSIFAFEISGRFDVGGLQSYKECNDYFCGIAKPCVPHAS